MVKSKEKFNIWNFFRIELHGLTKNNFSVFNGTNNSKNTVYSMIFELLFALEEGEHILILPLLAGSGLMPSC